MIKSIREMSGLFLRMYAENKKHTNNRVTSVIPKRYLKDGIFFIKYKLPSKRDVFKLSLS
jgi:Ni,Fe-hydrogenase III component G